MAQQAFDYLSRVDEACRASSTKLPTAEQSQSLWTGVGFMVGKNDLIVEMDDVVEILEHVDVTRIPSVQPWFKGIANVRGNLMPVVDLGFYLFGESTRLNTNIRYIVIESESTNIALMVGAVMGMRSFRARNKRDYSKKTHEGLRPYLSHAFETTDEYWNVFNMNTLVSAETFNQISTY